MPPPVFCLLLWRSQEYLSIVYSTNCCKRKAVSVPALLDMSRKRAPASWAFQPRLIAIANPLAFGAIPCASFASGDKESMVDLRHSQPQLLRDRLYLLRSYRRVDDAWSCPQWHLKSSMHRTVTDARTEACIRNCNDLLRAPYCSGLCRCNRSTCVVTLARFIDDWIIEADLTVLIPSMAATFSSSLTAKTRTRISLE